MNEYVYVYVSIYLSIYIYIYIYIYLSGGGASARFAWVQHGFCIIALAAGLCILVMFVEVLVIYRVHS